VRDGMRWDVMRRDRRVSRREKEWEGGEGIKEKERDPSNFCAYGHSQT